MSVEKGNIAAAWPGEIRILQIEDVPVEAEFNMRQVRKGGITAQWCVVDNEQDLSARLRDFHPHIVLSDFSLPGFDGLSALRIVQKVNPNIPFIFVSGTIGEERAVEILRCGAVDYILKDNLTRLPAAITRALREAEIRVDRQRKESQIVRLTRVLRTLSGINGAVVRIRERRMLLDEACRLAVRVGGYPVAAALLKRTEGPGLEVAACNGLDRSVAERLQTAIAGASATEADTIGRVLTSGKAFICEDPKGLDGNDALNILVRQMASRPLVILPLMLESTAWGVLILVAPDSRALVPEELEMLHEMAANLSFALQYLQKDSEVRFLSYFDVNTGLAKRPLFCDRIRRLIAAADGQPSCAVVIFDIEKLSVINDSFGRHIGDRLLQLVAERLRRALPDIECVAYLGGGTFALALDEVSNSVNPMRTMQEQLGRIFVKPFDIELRSIPVTIKCGVALCPEDGTDADVLVQNAEAALGDARAGEQKQVQYSNVHRSEVVGRLALEHKLRNAIERREFELHYQPQFNARTRRIDCVEGLIRWRSPEDGLVSPAAFLPLLETTGLIAAVGDWVIEQAAADFQTWRRLGLPKVRIAVNVSPRELRRPDFAREFLKRIDGCGADSLDVEITEVALLDDGATAVRELETLRKAGVRIAIDDFGTGYSSLSRLCELPINTLKIDKTFISRLVDDQVGRTLVSTIITLAHAIGMNVVAEGVETPEQLNMLCELGCDQLQGYLLSKPLPCDKAMEFLAANAKGAAPETFAWGEKRAARH